jgi:hypothetical protein
MIAFPAKAGTHRADIALADEWVPAFAGKAMVARRPKTSSQGLPYLVRDAALRRLALALSEYALHPAQVVVPAIPAPEKPN